MDLASLERRIKVLEDKEEIKQLNPIIVPYVITHTTQMLWPNSSQKTQSGMARSVAKITEGRPSENSSETLPTGCPSPSTW